MAKEKPPVNVESTLAAAAHALLRRDRVKDAELLASANVTMEPSGYDNWDGGTTIWELGLEVPYPNYLLLEDRQREDLEKFIDGVIKPFLPEIGHWVNTKIKPAEFTDPNWRRAVATRALPLDKYQTIDPVNDRLVFISYQTADRYVAGKLQKLFEEAGLVSFLAHEDIEVSAEWRERILEELGKARIFVSLLSKNYFKSPWCMQEAGIAAYRGITSLHLSLDGEIPRGFSSNIQSVKADPENISIKQLVPGIVASDFDLGIELITNIIGRSGTFRNAEANLRMIVPYIQKMNDSQVKNLLEKICANNQVHHASQCASEYIPPLLESHGQLLDKEKRKFLLETCAKYKF